MNFSKIRKRLKKKYFEKYRVQMSYDKRDSKGIIEPTKRESERKYGQVYNESAR